MKWLTWAVMLYLAADFADPSLPGAFTFNADESIEVVHLHKVPIPDPPDPSIPPSSATPLALDLAYQDWSARIVQPPTAQRAPDRWTSARRDLHQRAFEPTHSEEG